MCGRYMIVSNTEALRRLFRFPELPNLEPRYNVAPTQDVPAKLFWMAESSRGPENRSSSKRARPEDINQSSR